MKATNILHKYVEISLIKKILVGMAIGIILGLFVPSGVDVISLLGTLFVKALKAAAPVLVFFLCVSALMNAKGFSGNMKTVVLLYVCGTFLASLVAVAASYLFPTELVLSEATEQSSPGSIGAVLTTLVTNVFTNPVEALTNANFLGILAWGICLGIVLRKAKEGTKQVFTDISDAILKLVRGIIQLAPFGVLGLCYDAVSTSGIEIFTVYGKLVLVLVGAMLVVALIANPLIVFLFTKKNPYPLVFRTLKDSGITAFFTRSSAANVPVNMALCEKLGLNKNFYSVSIPLGATINMAGAAITIAVMAMAAAYTNGIQVDFLSSLLLCLVATIGACGASGVPGGSLLLIPLACSLFGIGADIAMEVVAIGFIIGVIQDSCETALNSSSDVLFTATADYRTKMKAGEEVHMGKDAVVESVEAE